MRKWEGKGEKKKEEKNEDERGKGKEQHESAFILQSIYSKKKIKAYVYTKTYIGMFRSSS